MKQLFLLVLVVLSLLAPISAQASDSHIYYVSQQHGKGNNNGLTSDQPKQTIHEALNLAKDGDTIIVGPGRYRENIVIKHSINLIGEDPADTIIDGQESSSCITLKLKNIKREINIKGFTITNGDSMCGGGISHISIENSHDVVANISNCIIANNTASIMGGGLYGVFTMFDCVIANNTAGERGGGIYHVGQLKLIRCTIISNTATKSGGGIFTDWGSEEALCVLDEFTRSHMKNNKPDDIKKHYD